MNMEFWWNDTDTGKKVVRIEKRITVQFWPP